MGQLRASLTEFDDANQVGDWCFSSGDEYLIVRLHEREDGVAAIRVKPYAGTPPAACAVWQWDGNHEAPTLSPSILHHSELPWHGYLRAGQLVTA